MKQLARACLRLALLAVPVVIAACYGPIARFGRSGKVIDKETHEGLSDIRVSCIKNGATLDSTLSYSGDFSLYFDEPCDSIDAEDTVTGDAGVARYQKTSLPYSEGTGTLTIQLEKTK